MLAFSRRQRDSFRQAQLDTFAGEAELFLRRYFEARVRRCSSADLREAALKIHALGRDHGLTRRGELLSCLACACVCGLFLFDDPRCVWLFHQDPRPENLAPVTDFNIDTFAANLDAPDLADFFAEDPLAGCEAAVLLAEQQLQTTDASIERALRAMTPARERLLATQHTPQFLALAGAEADRRQLGPRARTRHVLIAWWLGLRFLEDPLCRGVLPFLRAADSAAG